MTGVNSVAIVSLFSGNPLGVVILGVRAAFLVRRGSGGLDARLLRVGLVVGVESMFSPSVSSSLNG